jgi:predicted nucleic acid-binding protein
MGYLELGISYAILEEIQDVLVRKFLSEKDAMEARAYVESITRRVHPKRSIKAVADDPDDDAILECAVEHVSDFVISADKHLLKMVRFEGVPIVPIQQFMERAFGISSKIW